MSLIDDLVKLEEEAKELVAGADDAAKLEAARVELLGRKGRITGLMRMMGKLAPEDRPVMGKRANEMRQLIEGMIDERTTEMKAAALKHALEHEAVDITLPGIRPQIGHQHLIKQIIEEAEDIFCGIGYTVESGPMVDTSYYNFTALNAPMDHPSRSARDTFYVVDNKPGSVAHPEAHAHGESDVLLRTQTSGVQIHTMESQKPPIYMICPGTVYRPDTADACHLPQFNQIEGLVVDEGITFGDLKGTLDYFVKCMFGEDRKTRYRPHFFPFTEPSCEVDVSCHVCGGKGCNFCKHSGWIEILGCGMVDPNVLINCGIGYTVESGPMVDTSYYNFTALNAPMDHPSRSARDTFYVVDNNPGSVAHPEAHAHGESDVLLRTQTSGVQIHTMESQKPPIYMICPGTVYRPDTADACHLPQFNQIEGLVVDEGITFGDLKGTLDYFVKCMFGEDRKTRYRPHFFPFTEPSCEVDVSCHVCGGKGCNFCKHSGWIEILGCGMVDPNVLINCGIDPEKYTGFAFGIGAERVAALRYDLPDLRTLMTGDMRFLNQF